MPAWIETVQFRTEKPGRAEYENRSVPIANLNVDAIVKGMGQNWPIRGNYRMDATIAGTVGSPHGSASLSVSDLSACGENLGRLALRANVVGHEVELAQLQLVWPQSARGAGRLEATGGYDLDSKTYRSFIQLQWISCPPS